MHATSVGIDINPFWVLWTRAKIVLFRSRAKVKVIWGNFFNHDLRRANVVTLYLFQDTNNRLKPKLERELKPGTRIISYIFTFDGWKLEKVDHESKIYMYKIGDAN